MTVSLLRALLLQLAVVLVACGSTPPTTSPDASSDAVASPSVGLPTGPQATPTLGPIPSVALSPTPTGSLGPTDTPTSDPTAGTPPPTLPAGPLADAFGAQLDSILEEQQVIFRIPGLSAAVIFPDGSRWELARGFADIGREVETTRETTFVVGSITKTFVTAAVMQLVDEGGLSLDDPLSDYVADFPNAENITIAELASHTSGLYDYFQHPEYNLRVFNEPDHEWRPREILSEFVLEPYFAPGTGYHYSNTNFVLLGLVVQEAAGMPLPDVLRLRFFEPLGLDSTWSQAAGPPPTTGSLGYLVQQRGTVGLDDGTTYRPTFASATVAFGAGDIVSTASDLADWAHALFGGEVVSADSLALMENYRYSADAQGTYGLGTRTRLIGQYRLFGHTGSLRGFDAAMWYVPEADLTIVVLTNRGRIDVNPIVDALAAPIIDVSAQGAAQ
ncbi:MAG: serine hydrolase [Candidatus Limnocylindrales bacterium]